MREKWSCRGKYGSLECEYTFIVICFCVIVRSIIIEKSELLYGSLGVGNGYGRTAIRLQTHKFG